MSPTMLALLRRVETDTRRLAESGYPIGRGSGLVRDGDYWNNVPCPRCWPAPSSSAR